MKFVELNIMEKRELKENRKGFAMRKYSAIRRACMMKDLILGLKYFAFRNPHSEIGGRGFTLIEIIVLIVIAGIILPTIVIPFATGIRGSKKPEMVTTAMYFAHQRMEELMKFDYSRAPDLNPTDFVAFPTGVANYPGENEIHYVDNNFTVVGDGIQPTNDRGYKRIIVRVRDPETTAYEIYAVVTNFP